MKNILVILFFASSFAAFSQTNSNINEPKLMNSGKTEKTIGSSKKENAVKEDQEPKLESSGSKKRNIPEQSKKKETIPALMNSQKKEDN